MKTSEGISIRFFNNLDIALKSYKQGVQKTLAKNSKDITFDQWQVLSIIKSNPEMKQIEIAAKACKDTASVTRIIELMQKKGLLTREVNKENRRRTILGVTELGEKILIKAGDIINEHSIVALKGIKAKRMKRMRKDLKLILKNSR
ncbi:MAG: MarR family transcriptional regulator [Ignavibacteria bacterium]